MTIRVYNLEFPDWCNEIIIYGYRFTRAEDYEDKYANLQHLVPHTHEFSVDFNTGQHAVTAYVDVPSKQKRSIFEWASGNAYALMDILLLLSLFTSRDVFVLDGEEGVIIADPRLYQWGGVIGASQKYKGVPVFDQDEDYIRYDIGFEECLNKTYKLIRSKKWQKQYHHGYFLLLARAAFRRQALESSFIQCWTIWEHLFTLHNQSWLSEDQIRNMSSHEKIAFIMVEYGIKDIIDKSERKRIQSLSKMRNRLIHFGRFSEGSVNDDAVLFIRLTEFVIAKILGLEPSNLFNTLEKIEKFFNNAGTMGSNKGF